MPVGQMPCRPKILPLVGLRAFAIAAVLAFHYNVPYADGGFVGVDIFFVLSGYLITTLLLNELVDRGTVDVSAFFRRRAARLAPALLIVVLAVSIATLCLPLDFQGALWRDLPWVLSYTSNWKRAFFDRFGDSFFFNHSWSLSIEEQFYIIWPLILVATYRIWSVRGVLVASVVMVVGIMWWRLYLLASGAHYYRLYHGFDTHADPLLIGCALAAAMSIDHLRQASLRAVRRFSYLPLVLLALLPLIGVLCPADSMMLYSTGLPLIDIISAIAIVSCHEPGAPLARLLSRQSFIRLGTISYGVYLWHIPLKSFFIGAGLGFETPQRFVCLGLTLACAAASYYCVERRFLTRGRSYGASMREADMIAFQRTATPRQTLGIMKG